MAKHSSFRNLIALEACRNFFLLAGISLESREAQPAKLPASDVSAWREELVQATELAHPDTERSFPDACLED
jgi:hypothetical protein